MGLVRRLENIEDQLDHLYLLIQDNLINLSDVGEEIAKLSREVWDIYQFVENLRDEL